MKFIEETHRHAHSIIKNDIFLSDRYNEFLSVISSISEDDLIRKYNEQRVYTQKKAQVLNL